MDNNEYILVSHKRKCCKSIQNDAEMIHLLTQENSGHDILHGNPM